MTTRFNFERGAFLVALIHALATSGTVQADAIALIEAKAPKAVIFVDGGLLTPAQQNELMTTTRWFVDALAQASGARLSVSDPKQDRLTRTVLLTTALAQPETAKRLRLPRDRFDAYAIESTRDRLTLIGANVYALRHAVAHVLRDLGFRYYAPSPRWHIVPSLADVRVDLNLVSVPDVESRKIWYAYGQPDKALSAGYEQWVMGNRLSDQALVNTGHSYGNIILRNAAEFAKHPEFYALLENGHRDHKKSPQASKFCTSNADLLDLVARDRIKLLAEKRKLNPHEYMVSVDPSDGQGSCACASCKKLGTSTDRVIHLANHVARKLREVYQDGWVGLYAYSSHRLPPTIAIEPNVYVQVALGFNQTEFTLPELVERWSRKVTSLGLREYYGVEAWDWGLPGRMRGARSEYHKEWIPYYVARKATAYNAETNANWGGQMLGLFVAAELMWNVKANVPALEERFFSDCFGKAAPAMKDLFKKFDAGGPLQSATLRPMFADLERAASLESDARIQPRLVDMMAYLVYVDSYRAFVAAGASRSERDDAYYRALKPLMTYAWQIRSRDMVHYYALARRLCNGLPLQDKRDDFYMNRKGLPPVWMVGEQLTDDEVRTRFRERLAALKTDTDRHAHYSRNFQAVRLAGTDAGPSSLAADPKAAGLAQFRGKVTGYLIGAEKEKIVIGLKAIKRPVTFTLFARGSEVLHKHAAADAEKFTDIDIELPKAGEYRFTVEGDVILRTLPKTPLLFEASVNAPAWVDYSGPHYFYVPRGTKHIIVDSGGRLSIHPPNRMKRIEVTPATRHPDQGYTMVEVPEGADGKIWHTDRTTRGQFLFLNIPPLLSLSRDRLFVPREVAESDGLTTAP